MGEPIGVRYAHVTKTFRQGPNELTVLNGVTFDVAPGEFLALMGPSGSGKSTLLNLTGGIDRPTSGQVVVGSTEPAHMTENQLCDWRLKLVGFVFQRYHLLSMLTAEENIELPLLPFKLSRAERQRRVHSALELVGLTGRAKAYPKQLSGGEEQRVAIARTIVNDPSLILADEPTGDLDTSSAHAILELLTLLNTNFQKTIIMVTHDAGASRFAHRTLHLHKGLFVDASQIPAY
jgi:putative ABC transport system ATP-binding protein